MHLSYFNESATQKNFHIKNSISMEFWFEEVEILYIDQETKIAYRL